MSEPTNTVRLPEGCRVPGQVVERLVGVLGPGRGVVVLPTDSVYGIGALAVTGNPGHGRVFAIKGRDRSQTLPLLVAEPEDLEVYGAGVPGWASRAARALWPGALTFVVRASEGLPDEYKAADGTVALRVPDAPLVRSVIERAGAPLAMTSANTHGAPSPASFDELEEVIAGRADLVVDGGACPVGTASTIVDATGAEPRILREGSVTLDDVLVAGGLRPAAREAGAFGPSNQ